MAGLWHCLFVCLPPAMGSLNWKLERFFTRSPQFTAEDVKHVEPWHYLLPLIYGLLPQTCARWFEHISTDLQGLMIWWGWELPAIHPVPSGYVNILLLKMAIEIVDFPIENGDFPLLCKRLPEGIHGEKTNQMLLANPMVIQSLESRGFDDRGRFPKIGLPQ